ncbi:MAG: DUF1579 domain-containing protein [Pseudomonadota bacterium]
MLEDLQAGAPGDFDFAIGDWSVRHRRLKERLKGSDDWVEFAGRSSTRRILGGFGNLEDNLLHLPESSYRAVALRSYDAQAGTWSIWWLDGRVPGVLDVPVVGAFRDGVGEFLADDTLDGRPIQVRFRWDARTPARPRWEQAFSADQGVSWETNWTMEFFPGI